MKFVWLTALTGYAIAHHLTPFISMQNHHSLLYREEEREMLPLLKVSRRHLRSSTSRSGHLNVRLEPISAPRRRMHPVESLGERRAHSTVGRDQCARDNGFVSSRDHAEKPWILTVSSWSGMYKGNNGSEAIVRRFVAFSVPFYFWRLLTLCQCRGGC